MVILHFSLLESTGYMTLPKPIPQSLVLCILQLWGGAYKSEKYYMIMKMSEASLSCHITFFTQGIYFLYATPPS